MHVCMYVYLYIYLYNVSAGCLGACGSAVACLRPNRTRKLDAGLVNFTWRLVNFTWRPNRPLDPEPAPTGAPEPPDGSPKEPKRSNLDAEAVSMR